MGGVPGQWVVNNQNFSPQLGLMAMKNAKQYNHIVEQMLDYVENDRTDQAASTMTVAAHAYTDPAIWEREMAMIFKRLPLLVALSVELPLSGDYKAVEILGKPLLITRQADGSVRAMLNVCSHRGMLLAEEGKGNCTQFTCPYHGWAYAGDGRLKGIPGLKKFGDVEIHAHGLTHLPVYERGGLIFAVLTESPQIDFAQYLGGMIEDIEQLNFHNWHFCGQREVFGANWKVAYDGYLEGYHFAAAHPETINQRTYSNVMHFEAHGPHVLVGFPQRSIAKLREVPAEDLWRHENDGFDFIRLLFPNVSIFVAPEITQIAQLIPGPTPAENRTVLYFISRNTPANEEEHAKLEHMMDWLRDVVDKEDYLLGLKVQRGLESGAHSHVKFGRNERGNQYFHKWVDYYLANDPLMAKPIL
jgi:phenylpropionate dioxygenase-like ring-hydroxylating dioxygenase large terminal subunit